MKKILILTCIVLSMTSCKKDAKTEAVTMEASEEFSALLNAYHEESLKLYPLNATAAGDKRYNYMLPNTLSDEFLKTETAFYKSYKEKVNGLDDKTLSKSQKLSKAILNWECDINLERISFKNYTPLDQMWTLQLSIGQLASGESSQPFKTVNDYNNWLKRLDGYLRWMASAKDNMKEGIEKGNTLPSSLIKKVLPQLKALTTTNLEEHLFYAPILKFPESITEDDKSTLTKSYKAMVLDRIVPAYKDLHAFMSSEYFDAGRKSSGISDTPNGKNYYAHQIKKYTTTEMTADEIHELGLKEVARILAEMEKVKAQVGYEGDLIAFFDNVRNNPDLKPFGSAQEVVDNFKRIHKTMTPQIEKLFDLKPITPFEVRRTEAFREASASAEYNSGSLDGTRPGIFYVPVPDVTKYNTFSDEALFLHEAIPGHHFQISLQQENKNLPEFRKTLGYSVYSEGWALYTESLGKELGLYTDPYQYFGMLGMEMHRAIRLVVDTGMHTKGWSREQAIKYSLQNEAESEASIISEIERYMANPGQALSYKIGQLKIRELRAKAETELGENFNIGKFHNQILESGAVPLALLETKITDWINSNK
ncbi:hypothetical protein A9Q87_00335 [Flavobacteriales bacterium 34_180_T64]|nr:hypothetical protein A9Q87_00335 [Flavobacteriales bacterium 34_180_T64]